MHALHPPKQVSLIWFDYLSRQFFQSEPPNLTVYDALLAYRPYVESTLAQGFPLKHLTRHLVGLYHGNPEVRQYRRILSERAHLPNADWAVVEDALAAIPNVETV